MRNTDKRINKYLIYDVFGTAIYGLILYFGFTWLVGFSLAYAYIWNFALIFLAIAFDSYSSNAMQSDKTIRMFLSKYDKENVYRMIAGGFVTFKTLLYFLYLLILIVSQVIEFNPSLVSVNLVNFIRANDYSILYLLAFDTLLGQFSKDRERKEKALEKLKEISTETQD